jgi:hypothetical protein
MRGAPFGIRLAVAAALLTIASRPATALTVHPWCMVYQDVGGAWACRYDSFAQCQESARGANAGFCTQNPAYPEAVTPPPKPPRAR